MSATTITSSCVMVSLGYLPPFSIDTCFHAFGWGNGFYQAEDVHYLVEKLETGVGKLERWAKATPIVGTALIIVQPVLGPVMASMGAMIGPVMVTVFNTLIATMPFLRGLMRWWPVVFTSIKVHQLTKELLTTNVGTRARLTCASLFRSSGNSESSSKEEFCSLGKPEERSAPVSGWCSKTFILVWSALQ